MHKQTLIYTDLALIIHNTPQDLAINSYADRAGVARSSYVDRAMYGDQTC